MYEIYGELNKEAYLELVRSLLKRSDSIMFDLPNMGRVLVNERNAKLMENYPIGYVVEEDQDLHLAYINRTARYLDLIRDDIIQSYTDTGYLDQISSISMEIFHVAVSEDTYDLFAQTDDFSGWRYPAFPEDPCFLSGGKCIFQCIAHERLCLLYIEDEEMIRFLGREKLDVVERADLQIPSLGRMIRSLLWWSGKGHGHGEVAG
ncbi:MAG: hypothetical protein IJW45_01030 [Oscillospiraceae bacterium]|nr:hypothetical protein [Oscillospiraceae bacterium]